MNIIYCDGATSNNGYENAAGGWAWVTNDLQYSNSGFIPQSTNNICELTAALEACRFAEQEKIVPVLIRSDSAYLINCYKQKWYNGWQKNNWLNSKKQPVANKELWEQLIYYFMHPDFSFEKVQGHSNDKINNIVDNMAVQAKQKGAL